MTRRNFIEHVGFMSGTALLYAGCKPSEPNKSENHGEAGGRDLASIAHQ